MVQAATDSAGTGRRSRWLAGARYCEAVKRWLAPTVTHRRFDLPSLPRHRLELTIVQGLVRSRWELRLDGTLLRTGRRGWLAVAAELLGALTGLEPQGERYDWRLDGHRCEFVIWPGLGIARVATTISETG